MPHFITSAQEKDHITSANDALWNSGTIGPAQFALGVGDMFACSMPNTNTLRIMNGQASCDGYRWSIDDVYEEYTIENGTPGYKRIAKAVADITTAPKEEIKILILNGEEVADDAGEPVEPDHVRGNLNDGDTHVQMPICTVLIDGINPQEPVMQMDVLVSAAEFQAQQKKAWDSINQKTPMRINVSWLASSGVNHTVFTEQQIKSHYGLTEFDPERLIYFVFSGDLAAYSGIVSASVYQDGLYASVPYTGAVRVRGWAFYL